MNWGFFLLVEHTFILGCISACIVVVLAFSIAFAQRLSPSKHLPFLVRLTALGYALPGSVLAVGIIMVFTFVDREVLWPIFGQHTAAGQILVGSLSALILAYVIRYFSVGLGPVQSSLERIKPHYQEAAQSLGHTQWQAIKRVYIPLLTPGLFSGIVLVLVDVMKEMPATLLMRPFGWDTLAVRVYEMTSEGEWERAALPALTLVAVSLVPVIVLIRKSRH